MSKIRLKPLGHRIIVKPDKPEDEVDLGGGKTFKIVEDERLARHNQQVGTLIAIGPDAWKAFRKVDDNGKEVNGQPWALPGARVFFSKNAGKFLDHPETGEKLLIMNDEDIGIEIETVEEE